MAQRGHTALGNTQQEAVRTQTPVLHSSCFLGAPLRLPVQRLVPPSFPTD